MGMTVTPAGYCFVLYFSIMIPVIAAFATSFALSLLNPYIGELFFIILSLFIVGMFFIYSCIITSLGRRFLRKRFYLTYVLIFLFFSTLAASYFAYPPKRYGGKNMQILDAYCIAGNEAIILLRNTGFANINITPGGDVTVTNTASGLDPEGDWYDLDSTMRPSNVEPGGTVRYNASCSDFCMFRFVVGGRTMQTSVQC